jgi:hypothetical protein
MLHIALLFKSIIIHGVTPSDLLMGTMVPIPKVKGTANVSDKYRAITLSSCIGKLFDLLLLVAGSDSLQTDDLQFGFKANCSTSLCSSMLNEINNYFLTKGSNTYGLLLDASKAFNRVNFAKLFRLLIKRGLNSHFVRFLLRMYTKQRLCVTWNGVSTESFGVTNGVRQGGVLSPVLFCVYLDEMLKCLRNSGYGCYIGPHFAGALAYADDVVLLSPTAHGLQKMSQICLQFADEYDVMFNAAKEPIYCLS